MLEDFINKNVDLRIGDIVRINESVYVIDKTDIVLNKGKLAKIEEIGYDNNIRVIEINNPYHFNERDLDGWWISKNDLTFIARDEELLTRDEKIFLSYLNFDYIEKNVNGYLIITYHDDFWDEYSIYRYCIYHPALKLKFSGLEFDKQYTRKELGL